MSHNNRAHEDLDWSDTLKWDLALTSRLVKTQLVSQLVLADGIWVVDLVTKDNKRNLGELLHGEEGIEFGLRLGKTLVVLSIYEEDNTGDLWEVVLPETTGYDDISDTSSE